MVIFQRYVSLPEGKSWKSCPSEAWLMMVPKSKRHSGVTPPTFLVSKFVFLCVSTCVSNTQIDGTIHFQYVR